MKRDYIEVFAAKLKKYGIKGKDLAEVSGRNPKTISEILNRKASPSIESFNHLIECCDRLSPGFADEYYLALVGHVDLDNFVSSLSSNELAVVLMNVSQRISKLGSRETAIAA
jgi:transcriptional regulator with XRE-family HTH domain